MVGAGYAILTSIDKLVIYLAAAAAGMLIIAVVLEARDRRKERAGRAVAAHL
jgi:hypothetical protein